MCATWFANTWDYHPPQYRVGLEVNHNNVQRPWPRSNIPYTAKEPPNEIRCLEFTDNTPNKKPHLKLINLICLSPL